MAYQNQHFVSQVLLRRFTQAGHLQAFDIKTQNWKRLSPKRVFSYDGYTQLLHNGNIDNTLEDEFGKIETNLPLTLAALDDAAQRPTTELPLEIFTNLCWYCAFLWRISPFGKAKASIDFVLQMNCDLGNGRTDLLRDVVGLSENDIETIRKEYAQGKKVIIDAKDFLQLVYRVQFVLRCQEDFILFRHYTKWAVWNTPIELPVSDIPLVQVSFQSPKITAYVLPIAPNLLLVGIMNTGSAEKSDKTNVKGCTFKPEDAEYWFDAICLSAQSTLASKNVIPDILAIRERAKKKVRFPKIVNLESVFKAGAMDFTGNFGVRLASNTELHQFIHSFVTKT